MKRNIMHLKKTLCICLASLLLLSCPMKARASALALTLTAGSYTITQVLGALGVAAGGATVAVLIGSFADEAAYLAKGAARELGAFGQYVYDNARSGVAEVESKFVKVEQALLGVMTSAWGSVVSGIRTLAEALGEFLRSLSCWGETEIDWTVSAAPANKDWGSIYTTLERFGITASALTGAHAYYSDSAYAYLLTACSPVNSTYRQFQDYYYETAKDIFAYYDAATSELSFYQKYLDAAQNPTYAAYRMSFLWGNVDVNGKPESNGFGGYYSYGYASSAQVITCSPDIVGALSIPVFSNKAALEHYVNTGEITDIQTVPGELSLDIDGFRDDVASIPYASVSDTITLPDTAEDAAVNVGALTDVFASGTVQDVADVITVGGLSVQVTDVPSIPDVDTDEEEQVGLLDGILALPDAMVDAFTGAIEKPVEKEEVEETLSIPSILAEKFPFCIPFDVIYLIDTLAAEPQAPRFEIPIKMDYLFLKVDHTVVVDLAEWEDAVAIFRIMMDVFFCACLIAGTRHLIKG